MIQFRHFRRLFSAAFLALILATQPLALAWADGVSLDLEAGPLFNQGDAQGKCPSVCSRPGAAWNGNWTTTVQGAMSVCGCAFSNPATVDQEAGPIYNQGDAQGKCPSACAKAGSWNGNWTTTVQGAMSVCGCSVDRAKVWTAKGLDTSRGTKDGMNYWQWDDQVRDHLDMNWQALNLVSELKAGANLPTDGRYIYVYRASDNKLLVRQYDRFNGASSSCATLYNKAVYPANWRGSDYLHVRHSQLDGGWSPLWSAGELLILNREITVINNESGHFKPPASNVNYAVWALRQAGVPLASNLKAGDFASNSANLTDSQCWAILHDEL